jgi:hypothetical protein
MLFDLPYLIQPIQGLDSISSTFSKEEIDSVVKFMPPDKSAGPGGFNDLFLEKCWHIIMEDIYKLCFEFYDGTLNLESIKYELYYPNSRRASSHFCE